MGPSAGPADERRGGAPERQGCHGLPSRRADDRRVDASDMAPQVGAQHERSHRVAEHDARQVSEAVCEQGADPVDVFEEMLGPGVGFQDSP